MEQYYVQLLELLNRADIPIPDLTSLALTPMWAVANAGTQCGMAFRFGKDHSVYGQQPPEADYLQSLSPLVGQPLDRLAEALMQRKELYSRAFCLAAMNALSVPLNEPRRLAERGWITSEPAALPFLRPEDKVVCVGYGYLIDQVLAVCPQVHVSDMRPASVMRSYVLDRSGQVSAEPERVIFHTAEENPGLLADADVVLFTGCTLVNGTWRKLLRWSEHARIRGLFGPSAALPPELIRNMGFNYLTTSTIADGTQVAHTLRAPLTDPFAGSPAWRYSIIF